MDADEIKEYRRILAKEFSDKDMEIETTTGYISIAALGFFITINDKFISLETATCKWALIVSLCLLAISFILVLARKYKANRDDLRLMDFIDDMKKDSAEEDTELYNKWEKSHKQLKNILIAIFLCLAIGIIFQVIFFVLNIN
ncbi:MAG: hypothetical protein LLF93_03270 [Bacteroidales bacterium]|nr:hypothetical protein [Bacteroidales bacterium]